MSAGIYTPPLSAAQVQAMIAAAAPMPVIQYRRTAPELVGAGVAFAIRLPATLYGVLTPAMQLLPITGLTSNDTDYTTIVATRWYLSAPGVVTAAGVMGTWTTGTNGTPSSPSAPTPDGGTTGDWTALCTVALALGADGAGLAFDPTLGEYVEIIFTPSGAGVVVPEFTLTLPYLAASP